MTAKTRYGSGFLLWFVLTARCFAAYDTATEGPVRWIRQHATVLKTVEPSRNHGDLSRLKTIVGSARVIGFAEGAHGTHEFLSLRNRVFQYLVEQKAVTAYAAETGFMEAIPVDDYVQGHGELTPEMVRRVFSWSQAPMDENRQLIEWIRAYNARPTTRRAVRFYGIDMSGCFAGRYPYARRVVDAALEYVESVDADAARPLKQSLDPLLDRFNSSDYDQLSATQRDDLTVAITDLLGLFDRRRVEWAALTSILTSERAYQYAVMARHLDANFRASGWGSGAGKLGDMNQRDAAQADNLRWVLEREGSRGRIFLFEQAGHLDGRMMDFSLYKDIKFPPAHTKLTTLGGRVRQALGTEWISIGSYWTDSEVPVLQKQAAKGNAEQGALPGLLSQAGPPLFLLDIRGMPQEGPFAQYRGSAAAFDALIFIRAVTAARPLQP